MIPNIIKHDHIVAAIKQIDAENVPPARKSRRYSLKFNNKLYPPKYVISLAVAHATGKQHPSNKFNAIEAKNYFYFRKYDIIDRNFCDIQNENPNLKFSEGKEKYIQHRKIERDSRLPKIAKRIHLEKFGTLACEICGFDFQETYGDIGKGYIEAHHKTPISKIRKTTHTKIEDLALVCANCHRMLHSQNECLSLNQIKKRIQHQRFVKP